MNETRRRVLDALADGPVTGPALADALDVSRAAVWKHVEALREEGFVVESTDDGYVLESVAEYGGLALEYGLDAPYEVEYHDAIGSTNDRARELAGEGASDVAVVAAEQTGGRGRLDREWTAPRGGVYVSVLVRPDVPPAQAPVFTLAAAVATANAAREVGVDAGIKWPNDVLVPTDDGDTRKLAGILTEMEGEADRVSWLVVGIGVNVDVSTAELPPDATSVTVEGGTADRRAFAQRVLEGFHVLTSGDPSDVLPAWRERALTLGQRVRVDTPGGVVEGVARDVEFPGALVVETDDGDVRVTAGDCEHLRSAE
ncbi:biotin--[acetyl-CoA-carboxylase] ligase [Halorubellus sp. JP-L1]|uniref:biotin--[acetyl-CoA-carboxylase] ligase n=1 Tax=Halorubellus sp. JP-L1 TaxID=2715753 RepID=UPI001409C4FD|nr:biotin--[acetyl-CoA-carboxylase] ligase [Halorubellus sp. JP-L1]NHN40325.1 biotin--[acetyl-CoA-carboxylase] ligase [Halorubellus sp. JP-L1]